MPAVGMENEVNPTLGVIIDHKKIDSTANKLIVVFISKSKSLPYAGVYF